MKDLHILPTFSDGLSYLYTEHSVVEKEDNAIVLISAEGRTPVPCASLSTLLLGPGTTITHAAVKVLADNGCSAIWCGEGVVRFYAQGVGETRSASNILKQSVLHSVPELRMKVVRKMYEMRFAERLPEELTLQQIRGKEGIRVRETYSKLSKATGVEWSGRDYKTSDWNAASSINKAISCANSCLYGVTHAGIVSLGFSPALGFVHMGKQLSFV